MAYRRFRDGLKAYPRGCAVDGCDRTADTVDHVPPLAQHAHVEGSGCCVLRGVCAQHNYGAGGRLGRAREKQRSSTSSVSAFPDFPNTGVGPSRVW
jgi:hypothetical protein